MQKYRKKTTEIEAVRFDGTKEQVEKLKEWGCPIIEVSDDFDTKALMVAIDNRQGVVLARKGDWIIQGVEKDDWYSCSDVVFEKSYESLELIHYVAGELSEEEKRKLESGEGGVISVSPELAEEGNPVSGELNLPDDISEPSNTESEPTEENQ
jgi:hypothetical protein